MYHNVESKRIASKLGIALPDTYEDDQLAYIANAIGLEDYTGSNTDKERLYNRLKYLEKMNGLEDDDLEEVPLEGEEDESSPIANGRNKEDTDDEDDKPADEEENKDESEDGQLEDGTIPTNPENSDSSAAQNDVNGTLNSNLGDSAVNNDQGLPAPSGDNVGNSTDNSEGLPNPEASNGDTPSENKSNEPSTTPESEDADSSSSLNNPYGNGYGALQNYNSGQNDATGNARRNFEHSRRMEQGKAGEETEEREKTSSSRDKKAIESSTGGSKVGEEGKTGEKSDGNAGGLLSSLGNRAKNGIKGLLNRGSEDDVDNTNEDGKSSSSPFKGAFKKLGKWIWAYLKTHPMVAIVIAGVIVFFLIILFVVLADGSGTTKRGNGSGKTSCTYNLSGISSTGTLTISNLKVELINCDGTESDYSVLETVDFEKFVLGSTLAMVNSDAADEAFKAQLILVRNFALTRNKTMCSNNQDNCFLGYNESTNTIRLRQCNNDIVYWNYEKDIYTESRSGKAALFTPEVSGGSLWKSALGETEKKKALKLFDAVKGVVLLDNNGDVMPISNVRGTVSQFEAAASSGKTYDQILQDEYGSSNFSASDCKTTYDGFYDYGDYVLSSDGTEILHTPLENFLESKGTNLESFNDLIADNVDKAGFGTRAGVVAAAVTLIGELGNNYGVKVPYYWGGGHYDGVVVGALGYWGSTKCHTYANGTNYNYCGLDCSGFVPWAIKNGGFDMYQRLANQFQNLPGAKKVTLRNSAVLEPGDLLESRGHIVLVVDIDEASGNYICAEASGNAAGVLFTRRPFNSSGYWGVDMSGYYESHVRSK